MLRPYTMLPVQQVFHPPQIPRSFFSDRGREQNGPRHRHACRDHRLRHRDQRGEAARVVRNARALEPLAAPLHRDVHLGPEDRVEMRRQYDRRGPFAVLPQPPVDITRVIDHDVAQADRAEQLRHVRGAPAFRARGRGNGGERRLAGERPLIGALDVMARRANAIVREQATEIRNAKLPIAPNCAARTVIADIEPIVRVAQEVGIAIEAATFIGSSPIRQYAEDWTLDRIVQSTVEGVTYAVKHGLPVMYVTEDTTRAKPEALKALYGAAIDCGATRICLADTVGHATPAGVKALVEFVKREIDKQNRVRA